MDPSSRTTQVCPCLHKKVGLHLLTLRYSYLFVCSLILSFLLTLILCLSFVHTLSIACFFTRGDLWQSWEKGAEIFDLYLLDSDWALNNANWQWLSCSNFFYQYFRCYSPIAFGKKTDKNGDYIRKYLPQLAKYPAKVCPHNR